MEKISQIIDIGISGKHTVEVTSRSRYELIAMPKYGTNLFAGDRHFNDDDKCRTDKRTSKWMPPIIFGHDKGDWVGTLIDTNSFILRRQSVSLSAFLRRRCYCKLQIYSQQP